MPVAARLCAASLGLHAVVMLKPDEIEIQVGRAVGGDFMKLVHKPTGIFRGEGPPLRCPGKSKQQLLRDIEAELIQRGLHQYVLPDRRSKR